MIVLSSFFESCLTLCNRTALLFGYSLTPTGSGFRHGPPNESDVFSCADRERLRVLSSSGEHRKLAGGD